MESKVIIDTNSIINFFRFYPFDKNNSNNIYSKLYGFIISKIKAGEIIVIDKVFTELKHYTYTNFKSEIKSEVQSTDEPDILDTVRRLSTDYYIYKNEDFFKDEQEIEIAMKKTENEDADLFLISLCLKLKKEGLKPILITDETFSTKDYKKLVEKIPTICEREKIECHNIAHLLFELYSDELKFKLEI